MNENEQIARKEEMKGKQTERNILKLLLLVMKILENTAMAYFLYDADYFDRYDENPSYACTLNIVFYFLKFVINLVFIIYGIISSTTLQNQFHMEFCSMITSWILNLFFAVAFLKKYTVCLDDVLYYSSSTTALQTGFYLTLTNIFKIYANRQNIREDAACKQSQFPNRKDTALSDEILNDKQRTISLPENLKKVSVTRNSSPRNIGLDTTKQGSHVRCVSGIQSFISETHNLSFSETDAYRQNKVSPTRRRISSELDAKLCENHVSDRKQYYSPIEYVKQQIYNLLDATLQRIVLNTTQQKSNVFDTTQRGSEVVDTAHQKSNMLQNTEPGISVLETKRNNFRDAESMQKLEKVSRDKQHMEASSSHKLGDKVEGQVRQNVKYSDLEETIKGFIENERINFKEISQILINMSTTLELILLNMKEPLDYKNADFATVVKYIEDSSDIISHSAVTFSAVLKHVEGNLDKSLRNIERMADLFKVDRVNTAENVLKIMHANLKAVTENLKLTVNAIFRWENRLGYTSNALIEKARPEKESGEKSSKTAEAGAPSQTMDRDTGATLQKMEGTDKKPLQTKQEVTYLSRQTTKKDITTTSLQTIEDRSAKFTLLKGAANKFGHLNKEFLTEGIADSKAKQAIECVTGKSLQMMEGTADKSLQIKKIKAHKSLQILEEALYKALQLMEGAINKSSQIMEGMADKSLQLQIKEGTTNNILQFATSTIDKTLQIQEIVADADNSQTPERVAHKSSQTPERVAHKSSQTPERVAHKSSQTPKRVAHKSSQTPKRVAHKSSQTPERVAHKSSQTPERIADKSTQTPERVADKSLQTPERVADKSLQTPERVADKSLQTPDRVADKSLQTPDRVADKSLQTPERIADNFLQNMASQADKYLMTPEKGAKNSFQIIASTIDLSFRTPERVVDKSVQQTVRTADKSSQTPERIAYNSLQNMTSTADKSSHTPERFNYKPLQSMASTTDQSFQAPDQSFQTPKKAVDNSPWTMASTADKSSQTPGRIIDTAREFPTTSSNKSSQTAASTADKSLLITNKSSDESLQAVEMVAAESLPMMKVGDESFQSTERVAAESFQSTERVTAESVQTMKGSSDESAQTMKGSSEESAHTMKGSSEESVQTKGNSDESVQVAERVAEESLEIMKLATDEFLQALEESHVGTLHTPEVVDNKFQVKSGEANESPEVLGVTTNVNEVLEKAVLYSRERAPLEKPVSKALSEIHQSSQVLNSLKVIHKELQISHLSAEKRDADEVSLPKIIITSEGKTFPNNCTAKLASLREECSSDKDLVIESPPNETLDQKESISFEKSKVNLTSKLELCSSDEISDTVVFSGEKSSFMIQSVAKVVSELMESAAKAHIEMMECATSPIAYHAEKETVVSEQHEVKKSQLVECLSKETSLQNVDKPEETISKKESVPDKTSYIVKLTSQLVSFVPDRDAVSATKRESSSIKSSSEGFSESKSCLGTQLPVQEELTTCSEENSIEGNSRNVKNSNDCNVEESSVTNISTNDNAGEKVTSVSTPEKKTKDFQHN